MPSGLQVHSRTAGYAPFHALALRRSEFRARRPPKAGEGKHENENGRSGSAVPSPQRNVNEIRSVQNTNHAPLPCCITTTIEFSELRHKLTGRLATNPRGYLCIFGGRSEAGAGGRGGLRMDRRLVRPASPTPISSQAQIRRPELLLPAASDSRAV